VPAGRARLFTREIGDGQPIVVLHGGPDFDHRYLLPELDRLAMSFRLIYYDQRGRGRSADGVQPEEVSLASELDDLERIRRHFGLETTGVLGHSWGGLLAMEYALRYPQRVSHLILLNTAPPSHDGIVRLRAHLRSRRSPGDAEALASLSADRAHGDLEAEAAYYRIHFRPAFHRPEHLEQVVGRLRENFTAETVVLARAIEERLYDETWNADAYDLHPMLRELDVPTAVVHGADDFIPIDVAARIADTIAGALLHVLPECGHFAYVEAPEEVERSVAALFAHAPG
jgi:proline iminopeptidase